MARQELNVFFQKLKSQRQPSFDTVSCDEGFKCTLIIPDVETDKGNLVGQAFTGAGFHNSGECGYSARDSLSLLHHMAYVCLQRHRRRELHRAELCYTMGP